MHHTIPSAVQFNVGVLAGACLPVGGITLWNGEMAWAGTMLAVFVACVFASAFISTRH